MSVCACVCVCMYVWMDGCMDACTHARTCMYGPVSRVPESLGDHTIGGARDPESGLIYTYITLHDITLHYIHTYILYIVKPVFAGGIMHIYIYYVYSIYIYTYLTVNCNVANRISRFV